MSAIVTASGMSFDLPDGRTLFSDLDLTLDDGLTALVGPNGVGKSCLARLLAGELTPARGTIRRHRPVALFPQRQLPAAVAVADYLDGAYVWSEPGERLLDGIDRAAPCSALSGGQWMRVRLARALADGFLILDEPTNDLDRDGRRAVFGFLRGRRGGALVISHDRELLGLCTELLELSNRGLWRVGGDFAAYSAAREQERTRLAETLEQAKRRRDVARAEVAEVQARQAKRNRRGAASAARGGLPKILLGARRQNAQATSGKLDAAAGRRLDGAVDAAYAAYRELKVEPVMYADLVGGGLAAQKLVAEARDFNLRFDRWLYRRDLSFSWRGNVRVAIRGPNGAGKSTLLRALSGAAQPSRGTLRTGALTTLHLDQRLAQLDDRRTVFDNVRALSTASDAELRNGLARLLFAGDAPFRTVGTLSGGERLRAALAQGFLRSDKPELLLLDEPTNNLDLPNIAFLEELVRQFPGALVVVSHDEAFLERCGVSAELKV